MPQLCFATIELKEVLSDTMIDDTEVEVRRVERYTTRVATQGSKMEGDAK